MFADILELLDTHDEFSRDMLADYVIIPFSQDGKLYMLPLDTTNKNYGEIVGIVQNRISIYLNEKY